MKNECVEKVRTAGAWAPGPRYCTRRGRVATDARLGRSEPGGPWSSQAQGGDPLLSPVPLQPGPRSEIFPNCIPQLGSGR